MTQCCNQDCNQGRTGPLRTGKAQDQQARIVQLEALLKFADARINKMREDHAAQLAAVQQGVQLDWWKKRADEIEAEVARTGSINAMRCYTDMRALLQAATHPTQQGLDAEAILVAVLSCGHSIERDYVKLRYEPEQEGHNALNQLGRRIAAALAAQAKQGGK